MSTTPWNKTENKAHHIWQPTKKLLGHPVSLDHAHVTIRFVSGFTSFKTFLLCPLWGVYSSQRVLTAGDVDV